jgi:hypothetical protein
VDKKQEKALQQAVRAREREQARAAFPIAAVDLLALFDMLDRTLARRQCDHTRDVTRGWLIEKGHPVEKVFAWLDQHGGFCDCEILNNVEQAVDEALAEWPH